MSFLPENLHTWYLEDADSYFSISFLNSNQKFIFGQIWAKKVKVFRFAWKLAHMVSWGCCFLFWHYFSEFQNLNPFLGKFRPKKSQLSIFAKNWHTVKALCFDWKSEHKDTQRHTHTHTHTHIHAHTQSISKMLILISTLLFSDFEPKSLGYWFLFWD